MDVDCLGEAAYRDQKYSQERDRPGKFQSGSCVNGHNVVRAAKYAKYTNRCEWDAETLLPVAC